MKKRTSKKTKSKQTLQRDAEELIKVREAVKQKFRSLKSDIEQSKMQLAEGYKPLTEPLHKLLTNIKADREVKKEPAEITPKASTSLAISEHSGSSTPKKQTYHKYLPSAMPSFLEMSDIGNITTTKDDEEQLDSSSEIDKEVERSRQYIQQFSPSTYNDWIETFHDLPRNYIDASVHDTQDLFDHQHGVKQLTGDHTDKFKIGDSEVVFIGKNVKVGGIPYTGTTGLYELLFKKFPTGYSPKDLDNYMDILKRTNAYRKGYKATNQIHGTTAKKYTSIIRPYLVKNGTLKEETYSSIKPFARPPPPRPRSASLTAQTFSQRRTQQGTGIMMNLSKNPIDYIYYDDPNELVNRLKILISSQMAGHTGHNNEIISILEELREAKVIK